MKKYLLVLCCFISLLAINTHAENTALLDPALWTKNWLSSEQGEKGVKFSTYATLATISADETPHTRIVQIFDTQDYGLTFFTHKHSNKVQHIQNNPHVALNFWLPQTKRQISIEGQLHPLPNPYLEETWQKMPKWMQFHFMGSDHKSPLPNQEILTQNVAKLEAQFPDKVPMPDIFIGYYLEPTQYTFFEVQTPKFTNKNVAKKTKTGWQIQAMQP